MLQTQFLSSVNFLQWPVNNYVADLFSQKKRSSSWNPIHRGIVEIHSCKYNFLAWV